MHVAVNLLHERKRKRPWVVRWCGQPDPTTGKQRRYGRTFKYKHEARAFYDKQRAAFDRGEPRDPVNVTLGQLIEDFEETRLPALSYTSRMGYRHTFTQLLAYFGTDRRIRDIQRRHAEAFIATRKREDGRIGDLSSWTRARHLIHCRSLFTAALALGYVEDNPFRADRFAGRSALNLNPKAKPWHHLTPAEFLRFLAVVTSPQKRAAYWMMYGSGLRPGEAFNLLAVNIDLERHRVHVVNRAGTEDLPPFTVKAEGQTVDSKERSVPIPEAAIPDLTVAMRLSFKSGRLVCIAPGRYRTLGRHWRLSRDGKGWAGHAHRPWLNRDVVNNARRDALNVLRKAGIELTAPFCLTAFRKSYAQNHADAGTPPRTLAKLLGHANTRVTMQYYNRVTDANEKAAGETMDRLFMPREAEVNVS